MGARRQKSELDGALDRLSEAVEHMLASAAKPRDDEAVEARVAEVTAERDVLRAEVEQLRAQHEIDARLRAEAAEAVKAALKDLRSVVAAHGGKDG